MLAFNLVDDVLFYVGSGYSLENKDKEFEFKGDKL